MKQEIITMFSKAKQWISVGINQALFYCKDWLNQVATYQAQLYSIAHQWLASQLPSATQRYDQSPQWLKLPLRHEFGSANGAFDQCYRAKE